MPRCFSSPSSTWWIRWGKLGHMATAPLTECLRVFLESHVRGVLCAYLFGSVARGSARRRSDIDLAVLYEKDPPGTLAGSGLRLSGDLERVVGRDVHLVVLNNAPVDLIHRVLRDGAIVFDRDPSARIRFEVQSRNAYFDLKPILDCYRQVRGRTAHG